MPCFRPSELIQNVSSTTSYWSPFTHLLIDLYPCTCLLLRPRICEICWRPGICFIYHHQLWPFAVGISEPTSVWNTYSGAWKDFLAVTPPITLLSYFATKFTITHVRSVINFMQGVSTGNLVNVCGVCQRAPLLHNSYFKLLRSYILVSFIFSHWFL